jgi:hypothetical protein
VFSKSWKEHRKHIWPVIEWLQAAGLYANLAKREFEVMEAKFLGVIVRVNDIRIDPEKVHTIVEWV